VVQVCKEEQVWIDHYLGTVQNIVFRFAMRYLNRCGIASWLTTCRLLAETVGVEERAGYYETAGTADMLQNHLMQLLHHCNGATNWDADSIRTEK